MNLTETIQAQAVELATDLVNANAEEIAKVVDAAEDGKSSIGITIKFNFVRPKLEVGAKLAWSERVQYDAVSVVEVDDKRQVKLPLN